MKENMERFEPLKSKTISKKDDIYDGKFHDIICKVIYIYDWKKSKGEDYMMTILVTDTSSKKLFLKIFNSEPKHFEIKNHDNIIVRNVKFFKDDLFIVHHPIQIDLVEKQTDSVVVKRKTVEIKDIFSSKFIDFSGFVIHKQRESHNLVILYMIDYTKNSKIVHKINRGRFPNNMILHVKIWDDKSTIFNEIIVGECYKLENLKVQIVEDLLYGNLSNNPESRIQRIEDKKILEIFEWRKKEYQDNSNHFYDKIFRQIDSINQEGFHKIKIKILGHTPKKCFNVETCKKCLKSCIDSNFEVCKCPVSNKIKMQVLKLIGEDESGKQIFLCKNKIYQLAMEKISKKLNEWECLVFSKQMKEGFVYEIRDIL